MNAEEFVGIFKKLKLEIVHDYLKKSGTMVHKLFMDLKLNDDQKQIFEKLLNTLLEDTFYTVLMGLDGEANIGGVQQAYKIYDEDNNLISKRGDIVAAAYEAFNCDDK